MGRAGRLERTARQRKRKDQRETLGIRKQQKPEPSDAAEGRSAQALGPMQRKWDRSKKLLRLDCLTPTNKFCQDLAHHEGQLFRAPLELFCLRRQSLGDLRHVCQNETHTGWKEIAIFALDIGKLQHTGTYRLTKLGEPRPKNVKKREMVGWQFVLDMKKKQRIICLFILVAAGRPRCTEQDAGDREENSSRPPGGLSRYI